MTNQTISITVEPRKITGRKVKQLRREGVVPANIFGKGLKSQSIKVTEKDFLAAYKQAGETGLIELTIKGTKDSHHVLVSQLQTNPVSGQVLHVDFRQVNLKEKVTAPVPVELIGEAPAVKEKGGVLFSPMSEINVTALPTDMPSKIEVDVSGLVEIGDTLSLKDLKIDTNKLEVDIDPEEPLVIIQEQTTAPEPEEELQEAETEEGAEAKSEEGGSAEAKPEEEKATEEAKE